MNRQELQKSVNDTEQRNFIKIGVLLNQSASDIHKNLLKALGKFAYSLRTVQDWSKKFHKGRTDTSEGRGGAHNVAAKQTERITAVRELLQQQKDWSVAEISRHLDIPTATVYRILTEHLGMRKLLNRWIPNVLTESVIEQRCEAVSQNLCLLRQHLLYLQQTLVVDETYVFLSPDGEQFRIVIGDPPQKVKHKRTLIVAMDFDTIAYWRLYEDHITPERYLQFLRDVVHDFKTEKSVTNVLLLHDDARPHKDRTVSEFLLQNNILTWRQPPHSPDTNPLEYACFHALEQSLREFQFPNWGSFCDKLEMVVKVGNDRGEFRGVRELEDRWLAVLQQQGQYL